MVLILDGSSEKVAHVRINSVTWSVEGIWLYREQPQIGYFVSKRPIFFQTCAPRSELPSIISTMIEAKKTFTQKNCDSFPGICETKVWYTAKLWYLDGNSEYVAHTWRKICLFGEKNPICDCSLSGKMP